MLHLKDNIKKIRKAYNETQEKFATRMGVTLPMQKTYEGGKSNPDIIYLEGLSKVSGIAMEQLKNSNLDYSLISEKVAKVTNAKPVPDKLYGQAQISIQEYIDELRSDKKELQEVIRTNLTAIATMLSSLSRHDQAYHETILRSLARLENRNEDDLTLEAGTIEADRMRKGIHKDNPQNIRR